MFAGQLEQAVCDGDGWPGVANITDCAAALFLDLREGKDGSAARQALLASLSRGISHLREGELAFSVPEGFAWYALYPDAYACTAERWARKNTGCAATVIGLLSIGTSLGAVVAEQLKRCGVPVTARVTLRPGGHPFRRGVQLAPGLASGGAFIVVDEGPGLSGSSMAGVAEALRGRGVGEESIVFFPGHGNGSGSEAGPDQWRWWREVRCWFTPAEDLRPAADAPGTSHVFGGFAAVNGRLETLAAVKHERQRRLAEKGLALPSSGVSNGWIAIRDVGVPLAERGGGTDFIRRSLAPHIAEAAIPAGQPDTIPIALERIASAIAAYAREKLPALSVDAIERMKAGAIREGTPPLLHGDGRLQPAQWVLLADGRVLKRDATGTDWDHCWTGPQAVLWDIAGAAVEWDMTAPALGLLVGELSSRFAIKARPLSLAFHRAGYCCLELARARHAGDEAGAHRYEAGLLAALKQMENLL